MLKGEAFERSFVSISQNTEVIEVVGEPIKAGYFVMGSIQTSGANGAASLQYSISGPKGEGDVYVKANKEMEAWSLYNVVVHIPETDERIQVVTPVE